MITDEIVVVRIEAVYYDYQDDEDVYLIDMGLDNGITPASEVDSDFIKSDKNLEEHIHNIAMGGLVDDLSGGNSSKGILGRLFG